MGINPKNYTEGEIKGHIGALIFLWLILSAFLALWNGPQFKMDISDRFAHYLMNYKVLIGAIGIYLSIFFFRFLLTLIVLNIIFNYILAFMIAFFVALFTDIPFAAVYKFWFGNLLTVILALAVSLAIRFALQYPKSIPFKV